MAGSGNPCGACKFLRRKCTDDCIFAPHFGSQESPACFAAIHKVFGASNVSKLLQNMPFADRSEAVVTVAYEAQARLRDPVYGCVAQIFALQQQAAVLQAQVMQAKALLARSMVTQQTFGEPYHGFAAHPSFLGYTNIQCSKLECDSRNWEATQSLETNIKEQLFSEQACTRKGVAVLGNERGELQALVLRSMVKQ